MYGPTGRERYEEDEEDDDDEYEDDEDDEDKFSVDAYTHGNWTRFIKCVSQYLNALHGPHQCCCDGSDLECLP